MSIKKIVILIIILILIIYLSIENFTCDSLTLSDCLKSYKCGFIMDNHNNKCVNGNKYGPYDKSIINYGYKWLYNDDYTRAYIANDDNYRNMNNDIF